MESSTNSVSLNSAATVDSAADRVQNYAQRQVQTFFDELKNGTKNFQTVSSLSSQIAQEYRGRCVIELLQNAHDALRVATPGDPQQISIRLVTKPEPVLLVANSGQSVQDSNFRGLCELGQSPKDPNESVGNKGLGFRSVLEICNKPEIWSTSKADDSIAYAFGFDPAILEEIASAASELASNGLDTRSPFCSDRPLVDWKPDQLDQYRVQILNTVKPEENARTHLSPYQFPLPLTNRPPAVSELLAAGHTTVVRLPIDGGSSRDSQEALRSIFAQLESLEELAIVFLPWVKKLVISIDGDETVWERTIEGSQQSHNRVIRVGSSPPIGSPSPATYRLWSRVIGDDKDTAKRLKSVVKHLPNKWPLVRKVTVEIAVRETEEPTQGLFVIFLPTGMSTGTGAHINAPFYGSLDRRHIDFEDDYNRLLLDSIVELTLGAVIELSAGTASPENARMLTDLLGATSDFGGTGKKFNFFNLVEECADKRGQSLREQNIILCERGWRDAGKARRGFEVSNDSPISEGVWRENASFDTVSPFLGSRSSMIKVIVEALGGSMDATPAEWCTTVEKLAEFVDSDADYTWNDFLNSIVLTLPDDLLRKSQVSDDPLAKVKFIPTRDGRCLSAADPIQIFFQPVKGQDDAADFVSDVPDTLRDRVAFLHPEIVTRGRNTPTQQFLSDRFVKDYLRVDLLRDVALAALPKLPVDHESIKATRCSEILAWALRLLGKDKPETLLALVPRLPVACHGGWIQLKDAVFGPGWTGHLGEALWQVAEELPKDSGERLRQVAILPPDDPRWGVEVAGFEELFCDAGVIDGFRLIESSPIEFSMSGEGHHNLPSKGPQLIPTTEWESWRKEFRESARPHYKRLSKYALNGIYILPEIYEANKLPEPARKAFSELLLASICHWPTKWERASLDKKGGNPDPKKITSPLAHALATLPWLYHEKGRERPLTKRWLVPESLLQGQRDRFNHLDPVPLTTARKIHSYPPLEKLLVKIGLNVYPTEDEETGAALLDALADAWANNRVPSNRFDIFLGQVRHAWQHLKTGSELPRRFLVRTGLRQFVVRQMSDLEDAYLPNHREKARLLQQHNQPVLEMLPSEATKRSEPLSSNTSIRLATGLDEVAVVDGHPWTGHDENSLPIEESDLCWIPVVLLALSAFGGGRSGGASTQAWGESMKRFRRATVLKCNEISIQLRDDTRVLAANEPPAYWLPGEVLAVNHSLGTNYGDLASAAQAILERQDLLPLIRLVFELLKGTSPPSQEQIEEALAKAEVDPEAFADVRHQWAGSISILLDRIRPVLLLLDISQSDFETECTDPTRLQKWLEDHVITWPAQELIDTARRCGDDRMMGKAAWRKLGEPAQLPKWNEGLSKLGDRYTPASNKDVKKQTREHIESAKPYLRSFSRHIAKHTGRAQRFLELEELTMNLEIPEDWADRWWEVPFRAVVSILRDLYSVAGLLEKDTAVFLDIETIDDLSAQFDLHGISSDKDPYDIAAQNKQVLMEGLISLCDLHQAWLELNSDGVEADDQGIPDVIYDGAEYLNLFEEDRIFHILLTTIGDPAFTEACANCKSIEDIRDHLGIEQETVEKNREERRAAQDKAQRAGRTFEVAGIPFEVGSSSLGDLFNRITKIPLPVDFGLPEDGFKNLNQITPKSGPNNGGEKGDRRKTEPKRQTQEHRDLVGLVGEIHAYNFLRQQFGNKAVTRESWVSELSLKARPLVTGETDTTSDSLGFDFSFLYKGQQYQIEVKSSSGDGCDFDLGITEIEAASRASSKKVTKWMILRVLNALSETPSFEWLPNIFEQGAQKYFSIQKGGMKVAYSRSPKS